MKKFIALALFLFFFLALAIFMIAQSILTANHDVESSYQTLTDQTEQYRTFVETKMDEAGYAEYANVVMTIIQMESAGQGTDVMGAAYSQYNRQYPPEAGGILDPYYSISCGMNDLIDLMNAAGITSLDDMEGLAIVFQVYSLKNEDEGSRHFETGYISYAYDHGGYTPEGVDDYMIPDDWDEEEDGEYPIWWDRDYGHDAIFYYQALLQRGGSFLYPVSPVNITSDYGSRYIQNYYGEYVLDFHTGIDLAAPEGTFIRASNSGRVKSTGYDPDGYGNYIIIEHTARYTTLYGHCSELIASQGDIVQQGDIIALVGNTGWSTGSHCHFEIRLDGQHIDPLPLIELKIEVEEK